MSEFSDNHIHLVDPDATTAEWLQSHLADTDVIVTHYRSAEERAANASRPWLLIADGDTAGGRRLCDDHKQTPQVNGGGVVLTSGGIAVPELLDHSFLDTAADLYVRRPLDKSRFTHHLQALLEARMASRIAKREAELAEREAEAALQLANAQAERQAAMGMVERAEARMAEADALMAEANAQVREAEAAVEAAEAASAEAIANASAAVAAAQQAQEAAEAQQELAEQARDDADLAREAAVTDRDEAQAQREEALQAQADAEDDRAKARAAQEAAEQQRDDAAAERSAALKDRHNALEAQRGAEAIQARRRWIERKPSSGQIGHWRLKLGQRPSARRPSLNVSPPRPRGPLHSKLSKKRRRQR